MNEKLQETWRPKVVYHYIQDYFIKPDFVIDISLEIDKKIETIKAFKSQFVTPKKNEPNSILGLLDQIKSTNSIYGRPINATYAEGFTVNKLFMQPTYNLGSFSFSGNTFIGSGIDSIVYSFAYPLNGRGFQSLILSGFPSGR